MRRLPSSPGAVGPVQEPSIVLRSVDVVGRMAACEFLIHDGPSHIHANAAFDGPQEQRRGRR